ncbi:hypothetical protein [Microvirga massiliensis]|uniref:hypothetical protein n=1 Tax=Microvirga massiliensis TaxID=1033741 RepID=UPI00062B81B7|nr:hypothetical protein [Microvirga massiliensis]
MTRRDKERLARRFDRLERGLPPSVARFLQWLREPSSRGFRIPLGILLVIGGFAGFLPILGFWMLPLGLLLLALDVPIMRRPTRQALVWADRRWAQWRRRWNGRRGVSGR